MLKPYENADFHLLQKWITDADLMFQFAGTTWQFPLTQEALDAFAMANPNRFAYIGLDDENEPYAYGEFITGGENTPRLGRLLVGESNKRGKGFGQKFIAELIDECVKLTATKEIFLFVFESNIPAIKCYEKLGFRFTEDAAFRLNYKGEEFKVLKMRLEV